jgi:hypothetical protein
LCVVAMADGASLASPIVALLHKKCPYGSYS